MMKKIYLNYWIKKKGSPPIFVIIIEYFKKKKVEIKDVLQLIIFMLPVYIWPTYIRNPKFWPFTLCCASFTFADPTNCIQIANDYI